MFIIKRQRITGIHSSRREVHDWLGIRGDWRISEGDAAAFHHKADADAERTRQLALNPGALSIVVRELAA